MQEREWIETELAKKLNEELESIERSKLYRIWCWIREKLHRK